MSCDKIPLVERLAVDKPLALRAEPWRQHLGECPACRAVWRGFSRSLAAFRQLEGELLDRFGAVPDWERLAMRIACEGRPRRPLTALRPAVWMAVAGMAMAAGLAGWQLSPAPGPKPARIVDLHPRHQQRLTEILKQSIPPAAPEVAARTAPEPKPAAPPPQWVELPVAAALPASEAFTVAESPAPAEPPPSGAFAAAESASPTEPEGPASMLEAMSPPVMNHPEMFLRSREGMFVSQPMVGEGPGIVFGSGNRTGPSGLLRVSNGNAATGIGFPMAPPPGR